MVSSEVLKRGFRAFVSRLLLVVRLVWARERERLQLSPLAAQLQS